MIDLEQRLTRRDLINRAARVASLAIPVFTMTGCQGESFFSREPFEQRILPEFEGAETVDTQLISGRRSFIASVLPNVTVPTALLETQVNTDTDSANLTIVTNRLYKRPNIHTPNYVGYFVSNEDNPLPVFGSKDSGFSLRIEPQIKISDRTDIDRETSQLVLVTPNFTLEHSVLGQMRREGFQFLVAGFDGKDMVDRTRYNILPATISQE